MGRLLGEAATAGPDQLRGSLVSAARELLGVAGAALLAADEDRRLLTVLAADPALPSFGRTRAFDDVSGIDDLLAGRLPFAEGALDELPAVLFVAIRATAGVSHVLALAREEAEPFSPAEQELAVAFGAAAAGALAQIRLADEEARHVAEQAALARAARTLNAHLDLSVLLTDICREAQAIIDADASAIYLGDKETGLVAEAVYDLDQTVLGYRLTTGQGLAGRVAATGESQLTNDYQALTQPAPDSPFRNILSGLAVPMVWDGALRGVLSVGYRRPHAAGRNELRLLETLAELAAAACRNANAAAGLALAARTDSLTGCLNHAALQDGLRREIERSARTAQNLSLVLLDLDGFKQVNEEHGHLIGDEVLRRVGHALRSTVRPYDLCARYGGDEFAIVCVDTEEHDASEIAARAIEQIVHMVSELDDMPPTGATAGVARWIPGQSATELLEEADRALLFGKQQHGRGATVLASEIPSGFRPRRFRRADAPIGDSLTGALGGPDALQAQRQAERLQKRTRQLVLANALGARLSGMQDVQDIVAAAVDELHRAFGYFLCGVLRLRDDGFLEGAALRGDAFVRLGDKQWTQPRHAGLVGRSLRERRVVLVNDVRREPGYLKTDETSATRAELVAPLWVGGRLWGAINIEEDHVDAFDDDDARLVQMVADQVGAALRSAELYEQLERSYVGTAEALARGASIVGLCDDVARELQMDEAAAGDLRLAAAVHDIGKVADVSHVEFLPGVTELVRHAGEHYDGTGRPDGLAGATIPLGARIIAVCDAATTDPDSVRSGAGTRFDPAVVEALEAVRSRSLP